jgi:transcriptional regulator of acetoin/glycerol metabolism
LHPKGGAPYKMTAAKLHLLQAAMKQEKTHVSDLSKELGITRQTLYRYVSPEGELRKDGQKLLNIT